MIDRSIVGLALADQNVRSMIKTMMRNSSSLCAREALKSLAGAKLPSLLFPVVVWLALSLGSPCLKAGVVQREGGDTDARQTGGTPSITARPERVTVTGGQPGSTEIGWDTGNGSMGFVFVTANGRRPVLFATGRKESRVVPWIRVGSYLFELCGDAERQTLLATVTVSGVAEPGVPTRIALWQRSARWLLVVALIAILYIAVYFSSTGPLRTKFPVEPTSSPHPLHVARNLLLGVAAFICLDGAIFHTGLYTSVLAPDSYAGRLALITRAENQRSPSGLKEVLVLGDSRMAEGFSTTAADKLGSAAGLKFVNLAEPASSVNTWYYMLREVDPEARRYWAIVVPYGIGYEPNTADPLRISMAAPLLRYGDCFDFASGFQRWSGRFMAFTACILRGSAYQSDVVDLLEHPIARIRSIQQEPNRLHSRAVYKGRDYDLVGTSYDPKTGQVSFPPQLTETQRQAIRKSLVQPSQSEVQYFLKLQRDWIPRIVNRYSNSPTAIVLTPLPRGPFRDLTGFSTSYHVVFPGVMVQRPLFSVPEQTFDFLEKPDYYFDAYHLNAKGRQRFTETLVAELLGRLGSADSHTSSGSNSQLAANQPFKASISNYP
jgi:hypothetical protein